MSSEGSTWLGYMGGGGSAAIIYGRGIYQFDLWNVGGKNLPTRVFVDSFKKGLILHAGFSHAMILVTGAPNQAALEGIESSGIDWEFDIGASAKALKGVAKFEKYADLFSKVEKMATAGGKSVRTMTNWAGHETSKRLVQSIRGELGVVQGSGAQFNILPSPLSVGIGMGLYHDTQTMRLMGGKQAWSIISPNWFLENEGSGVTLQMYNIPEQDGTWIELVIGVDEWGGDPYIRWQPGSGKPTIDGRSPYKIKAYVWNGWLWHSAKSETPGIDLGSLKAIGENRAGWTKVYNTGTVNKDSIIKIYPAVIKFGNYARWTASKSAKVGTSKSGQLRTALYPRTKLK